MVLSLAFALLLVAVVGLYYFVPRRVLCGGCGSPRDGSSPLCRKCGWIFDAEEEEDDDDGDDEGEPEVVAEEIR